ncbi:hypothetical protein IP76_16505 [Rhizobium sp. AAP43]|nr:hypothetical protein IP76_16505 [Rhizobium sp. AAP43]
MAIDQDRPILMVAEDAGASDRASEAGSGFKSSDPHIEGFLVSGFGFLDGLISTMNGFVCFAIVPPAGESQAPRYSAHWPRQAVHEAGCPPGDGQGQG